jgi:hypothetical protein
VHTETRRAMDNVHAASRLALGPRPAPLSSGIVSVGSG